MSLKSYVTLGNSGLRVSPLCLGTMTFGEDWGLGSSPQEADAILSRYRELGGNFLDTSNAYTNGHSEKIIGDSIGRESSKRDRMVIGTKGGNNLYLGDPNGGGNGAKSLIAQVEESLRRLQTDYIDLFWLHHWDWNTPVEETMKVLNRLVDSGKVRYLGVSDTPAWQVAQANTLAQLKDWTPFVGLQVEHSLLERTVEDELLPMAQALGLGVTPWSPLKSGLLSGKYTRTNAGQVSGSRGEATGYVALLDERAFTILDRLAELAEAHQTTSAAVALAWVVSRPGVTSTIIGARRLDQLEANVAALDVRLSAEELSSLDELSTPPAMFTSTMQKHTNSFQHGGISLNGVTPPDSPMAPKSDKDRY
ncbi:aldo/keto reductase [Hymenobacter sp. DG01]|uniref:aldo/keto reductase n=1 Tax=Hymenobacter sp. DG01 TaxID=2584940 RepID=UPI001120740F|nr:aldo/keto reductase [Hymenobacter sp. DG01]